MELIKELFTAFATLIEKIWEAIMPLLTPIAMVAGKVMALIFRSLIALITNITNLF